ncbi:MAG TPA: tetratricopeptide repeat protein [Pyrinomonadaceae bacterium]|nr:tetratricopeptide repeat protein [Pyrinomonadaceae bacterium]
MKRFIFPLAVSLCLLVVVSQHTTVYAKDTWVSVRTKNFFLLGNASEKDIRKVGLRLEQFREVFTKLFPKLKFNTPVPTTVIVFKSDSSYAPFKPRANTAGYFQPGSDVNYITLTTEVRGEQDPFTVIFHEYTHLLVENTFESAPVWFNEGLAEYYSTFSITDDQKIRLGTPIGGHVFLLRDSKMLPLRTLFEVDHKSPHYNESKKSSIFYAQSWALMHYLIIGKAGKVEQLGKFMELLRNKMPMEQAFQQAFDTSFEVMEKDLRDYVQKTRYNVIDGHFERKLELDTTTEATPLTEAEAQAYLGDLLLHSNRAEAYTYLEKALKLDPNLPMAHASLGMAYFREGKVKEAHASLERAVAANSQNYLAHYYYAFTLSRESSGGGPVASDGLAPEVVAKIREHLQKAIALRPDFPESYNLLAFMSLITGQGVDESIAQMKRLLIESPGKHEYMYMLGQLYTRKRDFKAARELLELVAKSNVEDQVRAHADQLLKYISSIEEANAKYEEMKRDAEKAGESEPVMIYGPTAKKTKEAPMDPSSYLREVLRAPGAGETQLQATLVRIECETKGIVFVVQTANGLLRLRTETFDDIELTTYDPKVNGEITCGARKPESFVVVCYLPNTDKKIKADGILKSIEFVPADFKLK